MRFFHTVLVIAAFGQYCLAQQALPDPAKYQPVDDAESARLEKAWLHSGDPRQIAWAAELIGKNNRRELIPDLIERFDLSAEPDAWKPIGRRGAVYEYVADALIRLQAEVPSNFITRLPSRCIAQELVLLSRSPDSHEALQRVFESTKWTIAWLAAANLLAQKPQSEFANSLLRSFEVVADFRIVTPGMELKTGGRACFGDSIWEARDPAWPVPRYYDLSLRMGTIFAPGTNPVRYYSYRSASELENLHGVCPKSKNEFVPGLLVMLGRIPPNEIRLASIIDRTIAYSGNASYIREIKSLLAPLDEDFQRLLAAFVNNGYVSSTEAKAIKLPVSLTIEDLRSTKMPRLPEIVDSRPLSPTRFSSAFPHPLQLDFVLTVFCTDSNLLNHLFRFRISFHQEL